MDALYSGGVNNPMASIEQISYLMFIKSLTEIDEKQEQIARLSGKKYEKGFSGKFAKYSWRTIARLSGQELFDTISEAFEALHELPLLSRVGKLLFRQAHLKIYNHPTLRSVVQTIDGMDYNNSEKYDTDVKGDLYEYLLSKLSASGSNGQFRTARHIIKMMVQIVNPKPGEYILDPACGTAGFLIEAYKYILERNTSAEDIATGHISGDKLKPEQHEFLKAHAINGYDNDAEMIKIAVMNLYLHGLPQANVKLFDPLCTQKDDDRKYDVILANPPFAGNVNKEAIREEINLPSTATELLFVKYMIDHLSPGGRLGVIVPEGLLFGSTKAHKQLRKLILDDNEVRGIVSIPAGVFKPYSGVKTSIIFLRKGGKTEKVWFYELTADGYSLDDKRQPTGDKDDIPDLLAKWKEKPESDRSWYATLEDIKENDFNLTASRYKPQTLVAMEYPEPKVIIGEALKLEKEIEEGLNSLMQKVQ